MPANAEFIAYLIEQLTPLGSIRVKRMFGGAGIYCDDAIFGLVIEDVLYIKADAHAQPRFEAAGMVPFAYDTKHGRRTVMSYWQLPDAAYDDTDELLDWAREGLGAARRASTTKSTARKAVAPAKRRKA